MLPRNIVHIRKLYLYFFTEREQIIVHILAVKLVQIGNISEGELGRFFFIKTVDSVNCFCNELADSF